MIIGIGNDIIEIKRVKKACCRMSFLKNIYTEAERALIAGNDQRAAGNFAVKESVAKVFGTGFRGIRPIEIEVLRDNLGSPYVNLFGKAKIIAENMGIHTIHVTITNSKEYAVAFAIGERNT